MNDQQRVEILSKELWLILRGLHQGSITSKPIVDTSDEEATEWPMVSLGEHIEVTFARCGINTMTLAKTK